MSLKVFLLSLSAVIPSLEFNIDTEYPEIFLGIQDNSFGHGVLQFGNEENPWIIVTAPTANGNGSLSQCDPYRHSCGNIIPEGGMANVHFQTLGASDSVLMACSPSVPTPCSSNIHLGGLCYLFNQDLRLVGNLSPGHQECPIVNLDVVFLFDGSNSLSKRDLQNTKRFMLDMVRSSDTSVMHFSVVQYSAQTRVELSFRDFAKETTDVEQIIDRILLMESITLTARAIGFVIDNVFQPSAGAREDATKLLIVITDGKRSDGDMDLTSVIAKAQQAQIIRCAIGVGNDFANGSEAEAELRRIASTPDYLIQVQSYDDLHNIFEGMKAKIYNIEGTQGATNESSFEMEMAQSGFSAHVTEDAVTLGAVGAYDWSGGLFETKNNITQFINVSKSQEDMKNSYLGYSVKTASWDGHTSYIVGAPRYQHKGKVVVFLRTGEEGQWRDSQHIEGQQIGSYFGAVLCTVDLAGNKETDLLLIGAPLYHDSRIGGTVTVCPLSPEGNFSCLSTLRGEEGQTLGRFGSAIAAVGDLNGDGLTDVAVGAPLEDGHRGSVYIYHGMERGISPGYSQRVPASVLSLTLTYFGRSLDGARDMTGDGLKDVTVGARGKVVLLRSRPVMDLKVTMFWSPERVVLWRYVCPMKYFQNNPSISNITICFNIFMATSGRQGQTDLRANLSYRATLEGQRKLPRVTFPTQEPGLLVELPVTAGTHCYTHQLHLASCLNDYLSPIDVNVQFSLTAERGADNTPILNERAARELSRQIPVEINCGVDNVCTDHLRLTFQTEDTMLVGAASQLDLYVSLSNLGEDSYRPSVTLQLPLGLHFRKLHSPQTTHVDCSTNITSKDVDTGIFTCNVSHPIFQSNTTVTFVLTFEVSDLGLSENTFTLKASANSENPSRDYPDKFHEQTIRVKYAVKVVLSRASSTRYITFTDGLREERNVQHTYRVENLGSRDVPVNVTIQVLEELGGLARWTLLGPVAVTPAASSWCRDVEGPEGLVTRGKTEDGPEPSRGTISCTLPLLVKNSSVELTVAGVVRSMGKTGTMNAKLVMESHASIHLDSQSFVNMYDGASLTAQGETGVEFQKFNDPMAVIVGSSVGGLLILVLICIALYKCGFFKRNYREKLSDEDGEGQSPTIMPREDDDPE